MDHAEIIELNRCGLHAAAPATWADFGAVTSNFTRALAQLLALQSTIYAVERDAQTLRQLQAIVARDASGSAIETLHAPLRFVNRGEF